MLTRQLGQSGIQVSALGFGCWPIGGHLVERGVYVGWGDVDDDESIRAIHRAMDLGVNFFDTANVYGRSEDILARAFEGRRDKVVIATKFGKIYDAERHDLSRVDCSPENMRRSLETSLRRLKTDMIDLYQFHIGDCPAEEAIALREELEKVVQEGKIRGYGWSTDSLENVKLFATGPHCIAVQQHLNLLEGNMEVLAFCETRGLASVNRGPLGMGLLTGKYAPDTQLPSQDVRGTAQLPIAAFPNGKPNRDYLARLSVIRDILTSNGRTVTQGALAWLWGLSENTIPIPGFKNMKQAEENARAMAFGPLTHEQMKQVEQVLEREVG
jgi:aryl-alcohol dehydrogenase-like predicted oxidoreductase